MSIHYQFTFICDAPKQCDSRETSIFGQAALDGCPTPRLPDGWKALGPHKVYCPKHEIVQTKKVDGEVVEQSRYRAAEGGRRER